MKEELKVLEVFDCYYPKFDGPCLVVTSYAKNFMEMEGVDAKVAVPKFPKYTDEQPFEVFRTKSIASLEGYRCATPGVDDKLKKFLRENQFDLIHIHSPFTMCQYFTRYGKKYGIPTVFTFHTKYREDFERMLKSAPLVKMMMRYIMKNINGADYVWTVSNGAADCLRDYGYKKDIKVIRNGTDFVYPENDRELIGTINQTYRLKEDETVLLSVGRIVETKKLQLALKALKIVAERGIPFKYLIVGSGNYEEKLKDLANQLGIADRVIFTGKIMDRTLLSAHYLRADLFLFPSTFDTASLAPIEAAALKLPTLMNRGCSTAEILTDNVNGYLAEENEAAWADRIAEILSDKPALLRMKEQAHRDVARSWFSVAEEVLEQYRICVEDYRNRRAGNDLPEAGNA